MIVMEYPEFPTNQRNHFQDTPITPFHLLKETGGFQGNKKSLPSDPIHKGGLRIQTLGGTVHQEKSKIDTKVDYLYLLEFGCDILRSKDMQFLATTTKQNHKVRVEITKQTVLGTELSIIATFPYYEYEELKREETTENKESIKVRLI